MRYLLPFSVPLIKAKFLGRPQRFLAEMSLPDGREVIAYCSNPGSLRGCLVRGSKVILWDSCDAKRKLQYTWKAININGVWVGTDTHLANKIVENAITRKLIAGLDMCDSIQKEINVGAMRADFIVTSNGHRCIIEVKSATIVQDGVARFPDSITPRGLRQLKELSARALAGERAIVIFVIQRDDVAKLMVTDQFYPAYYAAFGQAIADGVEVMALAMPLRPGGVGLPRVVPVELA